MKALGDILWSPAAAPEEATQIGRYLGWLREQRGRTFAGYDELHRWSVCDLEGFWGSVWDFFGVAASAPYDRVLRSAQMPGAEWFAGARLNYAAHMVGGEDDGARVAIVAHSQTRATLELTFGELREQVAAARAGLIRLGVGPGDRVVGLAVDRWLAHVNCQLIVGTDLDKGSLAAARLDLDDDGFGHAT